MKDQKKATAILRKKQVVTREGPYESDTVVDFSAPAAIPETPSVIIPEKYLCSGCQKKYVSRIHIPIVLDRGARYVCSEECRAAVIQ